jgi:hypothetical protein
MSVMVVTVVGACVVDGARTVMKVVTTVGVGPPTLKTVPMVFVMMLPSSPSPVSESSVPKGTHWEYHSLQNGGVRGQHSNVAGTSRSRGDKAVLYLLTSLRRSYSMPRWDMRSLQCIRDRHLLKPHG